MPCPCPRCGGGGPVACPGTGRAACLCPDLPSPLQYIERARGRPIFPVILDSPSMLALDGPVPLDFVSAPWQVSGGIPRADHGHWTSGIFLSDDDAGTPWARLIVIPAGPPGEATGPCVVIQAAVSLLSSDGEGGVIELDPGELCTDGGGVFGLYCEGEDGTFTTSEFTNIHVGLMESPSCDPLLAFADFRNVGSGYSGGLTRPTPNFGFGHITERSVDRPEDCFPDLPCDGCRVVVSYVRYCPDTCEPTEFDVQDVEDGTVYGPFLSNPSVSPSGVCSLVSMSARVCVPESAIATGRTFQFRSRPSGTVLKEVQVGEGCTTEVEDEGQGSATKVTLKVCVEGCPSGSGLLSNTIVRAWVFPAGADPIPGEAISGGAGGPGIFDGCVRVPVRLPETAGSYDIQLRIFPDADGYEDGQAFLFGGVGLPAIGDGCGEIDLGTVTAGPNEDHVCTCAGLVPRVLPWSGNGVSTVLEYDEGEDAWLGVETIDAGTDAGLGAFCGFGSTDFPNPILPVRLRIYQEGEDCVIEAERLVPHCLQFDGGSPCPENIKRLLARYEFLDSAAYSTAIKRIVVTSPWGPLSAMPPLALSSWTNEAGASDPNNCDAPVEAYAIASVGS